MLKITSDPIYSLYTLLSTLQYILPHVSNWYKYTMTNHYLQPGIKVDNPRRVTPTQPLLNIAVPTDILR